MAALQPIKKESVAEKTSATMNFRKRKTQLKSVGFAIGGGDRWI
jgi:hypothetical protein